MSRTPPPSDSLWANDDDDPRIEARFRKFHADHPECKGRGSIKHEDWQRKDGKWVRGGGRIPCPTCRGAKTVCSGDTRDRNP